MSSSSKTFSGTKILHVLDERSHYQTVTIWMKNNNIILRQQIFFQSCMRWSV
uniref:Uncharacterized protein n=1 Tax=Arion vulgaris TaxID=1028688 RepID=A0A0B7BUM2_9EUPU